jgi:aminoglycoside 2''-phosphotransferase
VVIVNDDLVFRFARAPWGEEGLAAEAALLDVVRSRLAVPVPRLELHAPGVSSHRLLRGEPLTREWLYRMPPRRRVALLAGVGAFLRDLHRIPATELAGVGDSESGRTRDDWRAMYHRIEEVLFPLLFRHQRAAVREHFTPVLDERLSMDVEPALIHGDLAPYHILARADGSGLAGVIDFGTAGRGDPATDLATLLVHYGAGLLDDLRATYPIDDATWERARFRAGGLELEWALTGLDRNDPSMLVAHIGTARDYPPMEAP